MLKKPHYITLVLVALLIVIVLNLPQHTANQIKLAIGSLYLPLFGLSKSSHQLLEHAGNALTPRSELTRQNDELRAANQELQVRAMQMDAISRENEQLRLLLGWEKQSPWKMKLASVIARDPANWWHVIQIDSGSRDGIRPDMPVVASVGSSVGLVGRVSTVSLTTSQVVLIGSPDCKIAALVEKNGETGVITGSASSWDNTLVNLSFLASSSNVKAGQKVVTWGEGKIFPKGIVIGQISESSRPTEQGYNEARVKLAISVGSLEEVWVLTP